ncbi:class I SAM-dependent methyltransferase [Kiloniella sp.]|uniref:class I SAM-dependent methyltransferase n=1 Tax=Kiloniella sp. TaxID=1938587 RepID=UPI003B01C007
MSSQASQFVGSIPENYDQSLGPHIFHEYAEDLTQRASAASPKKVLEIASGTGILTRKLRDALTPDVSLIASDLNPPMLAVAANFFQKTLLDFTRFLLAIRIKVWLCQKWKREV